MATNSNSVIGAPQAAHRRWRKGIQVLPHREWCRRMLSKHI